MSDLTVVTQRVMELSIVPDYHIDTPAEAVRANEQLGKIKSLGKELDALKTAELKPLLDETKAVREKYKQAEALLDTAEGTVKRALLGFQRAEADRLARERAEAAAQAAAERARLEEQARREREKAEAKAAKLAAAGKAEQAEAVIEAAASKARAAEAVAAVITAPAQADETKLAGFSTRGVWRGRVVNLRQFITTLAAHPEIDAEELLSIKQSGINKLAAVYKGATATTLPGLAADYSESATARAA